MFVPDELQVPECTLTVIIHLISYFGWEGGHGHGTNESSQNYYVMDLFVLTFTEAEEKRNINGKLSSLFHPLAAGNLDNLFEFPAKGIFFLSISKPGRIFGSKMWSHYFIRLKETCQHYSRKVNGNPFYEHR